MTTFREIIEEGEYEYYGVRAHRGSAPVVGENLGNSRVWVDGECTDEELNGICAARVTVENLDNVIERVRREYAWGDAPIVLVGGYEGSWGYDDGEVVIRDNICLATL